jgi:hypothetical protein
LQPRSLLSIARLKRAGSRFFPSICSFVRIDQTWLGFQWRLGADELAFVHRRRVLRRRLSRRVGSNFSIALVLQDKIWAAKRLTAKMAGNTFLFVPIPWAFMGSRPTGGESLQIDIMLMFRH